MSRARNLYLLWRRLQPTAPAVLDLGAAPITTDTKFFLSTPNGYVPLRVIGRGGGMISLMERGP